MSVPSADSSAAFNRLMAITRLSVSLQEATDEASVLRALERGLWQFSLAGYLGRLESDERGLRVIAAHSGALADERGGTESPASGQEVLVDLDSSPLATRVVRGQEAVFTTDVPTDLGALLPLTTLVEAERSAALRGFGRAVCLPMVTRGRTVGMFLVLGQELEARDAVLLRVLADHLSVALEHASIVRDLQQALLHESDIARNLRRLEETIGELVAESEPDSALQRLVTAAAESLEVDRIALFTLSQDRTEMHLVASVGLAADATRALGRVKVDPPGGPFSALVERTESLVVEDTRLHAGWRSLLEGPELVGTRAVWGVPLLGPDRECLGALVSFSDQPGAPSNERVDLASRLARFAALTVTGSRRRELEHTTAQAQAIAELARSIPHELGQPLAVISGYAELIAANRLEGAALREACSELVQAASDLAELVQKIGRITAYATKAFGSGRTYIDLERAADPLNRTKPAS